MNTHEPKVQRPSRYILGALPTRERDRQLGGLRREYVKADRHAPGTMVLRYRARWESPLDLYHDSEVIDCAQHQAGLWFGQAYRQAVSSEEACHDRARLYGTPSELFDTSDISLTRALEYVEQTYAALSSDTVNVVIDVCAHARPATTPEAIGKLRRGLGRMAREWGLSAAEVCQRRDA